MNIPVREGFLVARPCAAGAAEVVAVLSAVVFASKLPESVDSDRAACGAVVAAGVSWFAVASP